MGGMGDNMLSLLIEDKNLVIRDVDKPQVLKIQKWFDSSSIEDYKYAMGSDKPMTAADLYEKYLEVLINAREFFLSINIDDNLIGFIKGRVDYKEEGEIWIMSMLIDVPYQNKGIGKRVLGLIMDEFKKKFGFTKYYACIVNDNAQGKAFWKSNNFNEYRSSKDYFMIDNKCCDMVIMHRQL
jgi:RimJ/RimL family protein N-acetyltransferase